MDLYINDSLKKYFMSKEGANALATNDVRYINRYLNIQLGVGITDEVSIIGSDLKSRNFTKDDFMEAFTESNWCKLNFEDKAVICDWLINSMLDSEFIPDEKRPEIWFVSNENMKFKDMSSYNKRLNRIYVNPQGLDFKGVEGLRAISHETQHAVDDHKVTGESLTNTFINLFGKDVRPETVVTDFIDLDISKFPDKATATEYSKNDILLFKNIFSPIQPNLKNEKSLNDVASFEDFKDYMIISSYYASPMEMNAHKKSLKMVGECIDENNKKGYDTFEDEHMYGIQGNLIVNKCEQLQNIIGEENVTGFVNSVVQMNFYKLYGKALPNGERKFAELDTKLNEMIEPYFNQILENRFGMESDNIDTSQMGEE